MGLLLCVFRISSLKVCIVSCDKRNGAQQTTDCEVSALLFRADFKVLMSQKIPPVISGRYGLVMGLC